MTTKDIAPAEPEERQKLSARRIVVATLVMAAVLVGTGWSLAKPAKRVASTVHPAVVVTKKPGTLAGYVEAGNQICSGMNAANKALGPFPTTLPAEATHMQGLVAVSQKALTDLKAVPMPAGYVVQLSAVYADFDQLNALGVSTQQAMSSGNVALTTSLLQALAVQSGKVNSELVSAGLRVCGT